MNLPQTLSNCMPVQIFSDKMSKSKIEVFKYFVSKIIGETYDDYHLINNEILLYKEDCNIRIFNEPRPVMYDNQFRDDNVSYPGYDSFIVQHTARYMEVCIDSTFLDNKIERYILKEEYLFPAIDKLNINANYFIILFGINIHEYIQFVKVKGLSENNYKGTKVISFINSPIRKSIFIIKKMDLPNIIANEIESNVHSKDELEKIDGPNNVYVAIKDTHQAIIAQSIEIRWKKNIHLIQLIEYSGDDDELNSLVDIKPLRQ